MRASIDFTGMQLVFNMISDRLARFNIHLDDDPAHPRNLAGAVEYAFQHILKGEQNINSFVRIEMWDGKPLVHWFKDGDDLANLTGDVAVVMPIGTMIVRLAAHLFVKHNPQKLDLLQGEWVSTLR